VGVIFGVASEGLPKLNKIIFAIGFCFFLKKMGSWLRICRLLQFFKNRKILFSNLPKILWGGNLRKF
jgi:hypothetical protein